MKESKDHLDIDLEFLDRKEPLRVTPKSDSPTEQASNTPTSVSTDHKYKWKSILIVVGIVLFIGWAISSDSGNSSTSTSNSTYTPTTNSNNLLTEGGNTFICSDSNYNRAVQLKPSSAMGAQLASELDRLNTRVDANKADGTEIDGMYVDETDQYSIDSYNSKVESYNAERVQLAADVTSWKQRSDAFDSQIDTFNNYLDRNCTPK